MAALRQERDRLGLLLEITNSTTSKLDLPRLVEALSTSPLGETRCDFCALLLPDADSGELRLTILTKSARFLAMGGCPIHGSACGKAFGPARRSILTTSKRCATILKVSAAA